MSSWWQFWKRGQPVPQPLEEPPEIRESLAAVGAADPRVSQLLAETRHLGPAQRIGVLQAEIARAKVEIDESYKRELGESYSLLYGGGNLDLVGEDPRYDDGEPWDEVGLAGAFHHGNRGRRRPSKLSLDQARNICRWLSEENEYVIGAMQNRVSYTVEAGVKWRMVPRSRDDEDAGLTRRLNDALEAFSEQESMPLVEQELVLRTDRDGEAMPRLFLNADGPLVVRFLEPELLGGPEKHDQQLTQLQAWAWSLGVEIEPEDSQSVLHYWARGYRDNDPRAIPRLNPAVGIRHVEHVKLNVDLSSPRGWPTAWPIRKNMARGEKLLRNMSYVAALQAAIALIRKHEFATKSQAQSFVRDGQDVLVTNRVTGKERSHRGVPPGTVIDAGPGVNYEAPVSSVNASQNVEVLSAELRAAAVSVVQPEYMFSGDTRGGSYANTLVADGPPSKNFRRLQGLYRISLRRVYAAALQHEVFWRRLPAAALQRYRLEDDFPTTVVRDQLQETQRNQILWDRGILSTATWRGREGLDDETERRNRASQSQEPPPPSSDGGAKPPAGTTDGGPGGGDQAGNLGDPESAAAGDRF